MIDFTFWNSVDPNTFLADDWENDARHWAGREVSREVAVCARTMVEVGPGPGVDYQRQFKVLVEVGRLHYTAWEGSSSLAANLRAIGVANVECRDLIDLPELSFDIVYEKAVLEHQQTLEPALTTLLRAARRLLLINWYRPPAEAQIHAESGGVHYWTFSRADVLAVIERENFVVESQDVFKSGNECWRLTRRGV